MKWILYAILLFVLLIGALFLAGYALPAKTTTSRSITLHQPPEAVFLVLADVKRIADWNRNTEKVEMLPPVDGKETTRQTFKGGMTMIIITSESAPPKHLVRTWEMMAVPSSAPGPMRSRPPKAAHASF